jgi:hypothetical protein
MKLATLFVPFIAAQSGEGSGSGIDGGSASPCDLLSCDVNARCHELHTGEAVCRCEYKYYGDGETCTYIDKKTPGRALQRTYLKLEDMINTHLGTVQIPGWRRRIKKEFNWVSKLVPSLISRYESRTCPISEDRIAAFLEEIDVAVTDVRFDDPCTGQKKVFRKISTWAINFTSNCDDSTNKSLNRALRNLEKSRKRIQERFSC